MYLKYKNDPSTVLLFGQINIEPSFLNNSLTSLEIKDLIGKLDSLEKVYSKKKDVKDMIGKLEKTLNSNIDEILKKQNNRDDMINKNKEMLREINSNDFAIGESLEDETMTHVVNKILKKKAKIAYKDPLNDLEHANKNLMVRAELNKDKIKKHINLLDLLKSKLDDSNLHDYKELDSDISKVSLSKISSIRINVTDHSIQAVSWMTEAKKDWKRNFPDDELKEVCDRFLPYLYDDGFVVHHSIPFHYMFKKNIISIRKEQEKGDGQGLHIIPFQWDEIADRFLPFFDYLNKYYPLSSIKLVPYKPSWESRWTERGSENGVFFKADDNKKSWSGHPFSKFEEIMSRDNAYGRPMKIGEIEIEVENLDEVL